LPEDGTALEFSGIEEVFRFSEDAVMTETDFLSVLSDDTLVVASEIGQVEVLTLGKGSKTIAFPGVTWVGSLTAHLSTRGTEIWAVNAIDSKLYHWSSTYLSAHFKPASLFPEASVPLRVASFASPLTAAFTSDRGGLANFSAGKKGLLVEEVVVLDSKGRLLAHRDEQTLTNPTPERSWVIVPFLPVP
jgi:hypothetical protein